MSENDWEKFVAVIADKLSLDDTKKVTPNASFVDDLGADSLDNVELVLGLEEKFDVEISDDVAGKIITVQDAWNILQELVKK